MVDGGYPIELLASDDWRYGEAPELVEDGAVEFNVPNQLGCIGADYRTCWGWRSRLLGRGTWLWTYRLLFGSPGEQTGEVRGLLYLERGFGELESERARRLGRAALQDEVESYRLDERVLDEGTWPIAGRLRVARLGELPETPLPLRAAVPRFVVEQYLGGLGVVIEAHVALFELSQLVTSGTLRTFLYYFLVRLGPVLGDDRLRLVEIIRAAIGESAHSATGTDGLYSTVEREYREGPAFVDGLSLLFGGRPIISRTQAVHYQQFCAWQRRRPLGDAGWDARYRQGTACWVPGEDEQGRALMWVDGVPVYPTGWE